MTMRTLAWDIELTPLEVYSWSLYPDAIPIQMIKERQHMLCFGARWTHSNKVIFKSSYHDGEQNMLDTLHELLDEADATLSWNGKGFDSKHARREFLEADMAPASPYAEIDLMLAARRQFKFPSNKLDYVAQDLGVGKKTPHTGFQLWLDVMGENGEEAQVKGWRLMKKYQLQDVNLLIDLYDKLLPWIPNHPNINLFGDTNGCTKCGSDDIQYRGFTASTVSRFRRFQCNKCKSWGRVAVRDGSDAMRSI